MRISQKVKGVLNEIFDILLSYKGKDIGRFSNLHLCIFKASQMVAVLVKVSVSGKLKGD